MRKLAALMLLAGCGEPAVTAEGCPIYITEIMRARTEACVAAYHAEVAKRQGKPVTRCYRSGAEMVCVSE